jgi:hypothetical protein
MPNRAGDAVAPGQHASARPINARPANRVTMTPTPSTVPPTRSLVTSAGLTTSISPVKSSPMAESLRTRLMAFSRTACRPREGPLPGNRHFGRLDFHGERVSRALRVVVAGGDVHAQAYPDCAPGAVDLPSTRCHDGERTRPRVADGDNPQGSPRSPPAANSLARAYSVIPNAAFTVAASAPADSSNRAAAASSPARMA